MTVEKAIKDRLDIYLITYNRSKKLEQTLNTLLAENSPIKDFDIKIIDNNSTDETADIIKKIKKKYSNVHYEKNKYNIGGNANIMKAFYNAEKEYVWVLADNDEYSWIGWGDLEKAIYSNKDAIFVANYECPSLDIAQQYIQASFLPAIIYKTSLLDDVVFGNMAFNISNMFPHLAIAAKLINENREICILKDWIVKLGNNKDEETGEYKYTRGYVEKELHPWMRDMHWITGFANSILLLKDKKVQNYISRHNKFIFSPLNSARIFFLNSEESNNSLYNLLCIFCVLSPIDKFKFLLYWFLYYTLFSIIYVFCTYKRPEICEQNFLIKQYNLRLFRIIKTKLFQIKVKEGN